MRVTQLHFVILLSLFFSISCSNKKGKREKIFTKEIKDLELNNPSEFVGLWKIDSIAENKVVIDRIHKDSLIQVFEFKANGTFLTVELQTKIIGRTWTEKEIPAGKWTFKDGRILIYGLNSNRINMDFNSNLKDNSLVLDGNFSITSGTNKKPSFYLSKYKKIRDERIYGPNANK